MIFTAIACLIGGIVIGLAIKQERLIDQYQKNYDQIDEQVRKDLAYYKNLSESLKQDLIWEKHKKGQLKMILNLLTGLGCVVIAFAGIMLLCFVIGKIANFFSFYKDM